MRNVIEKVRTSESSWNTLPISVEVTLSTPCIITNTVKASGELIHIS